MSLSDWIAFLTSEKNANTGNIISFAALFLAAFSIMLTVTSNTVIGAVVLALIAVVLAIIYLRTIGPYGRRAKEAGKLLDAIMLGEESDPSVIQERWNKYLLEQKSKKWKFPLKGRQKKMKINDIFRLQDNAASENVRLFEIQFRWCYRSIEVMIDTHTFLANDPEMLAHRKSLSEPDIDKFKAMNVIVNMAYDAMGSLISALRLLECGVLADAWSLIRAAFESACYAEFFALNESKVVDYMRVGEAIRQDHSVDAREKIPKELAIQKVMKSLQNNDGQNRTDFYSRLCNFGTHASPVRSGLRIKVNELEVRSYLSIGHRELEHCLADFAATAKYTLGIPFDAWPDLMQKETSLFNQYRLLLEEYKTIYESA